ncbi:hypothetical protein DTL42_04045 [Bremerella cremea]|uniref:Uncharacterized protein n=1 Tax=Bremerella cremea TaxID=1031537 RepID=A0A368KXY5_9BACT|nr:hypothetical protein DTL42_04045 [Bremerella cremea]
MTELEAKAIAPAQTTANSNFIEAPFQNSEGHRPLREAGNVNLDIRVPCSGKTPSWGSDDR